MSGITVRAKHVGKALKRALLPTSGTVLVKGMDTKDEKRALDIRKTVGLCFQNPDNQIVTTIVEDDVAFAPENLGMTRRKYARVNMALKAVGMKATPQPLRICCQAGKAARSNCRLIGNAAEVLVLDKRLQC